MPVSVGLKVALDVRQRSIHRPPLPIYRSEREYSGLLKASGQREEVLRMDLDPKFKADGFGDFTECPRAVRKVPKFIANNA